jgi:uncharacterized MAPEG superfamily protein
MSPILASSPVAVIVAPTNTLRRTYGVAPLGLAFTWYFIAVAVGILLLVCAALIRSPGLTVQQPLTYVGWPQPGSAVIVIYTITLSCLLFPFIDALFTLPVKVANGYDGLAGLAITTAILSLVLVGGERPLLLAREMIIPTVPALQIAIALLLASVLVTISFATSCYISAGDSKGSFATAGMRTRDMTIQQGIEDSSFSFITRQHIQGTASAIVLAGGTLFLAHRLIWAVLLLIDLPGLRDQENLLILAITLAILTVLAFGSYIGKLLQVSTIHARHNPLKAILIALRFNLFGLFLNLVTISFVWISATAIYRGISGSNTFAAKLFGVVFSILASIAIWLVTFFGLLFVVYDTDGRFWRLFWRIRCESLLLDQEIWLAHRTEQIKGLFTTVLESAKSFPSVQRSLLDRLTSFFCSLYGRSPERAVELLVEVPTYTLDDGLWIPILQRLFDTFPNKQIELASWVFHKLDSSGSLSRVGPKLTSIPVLYYYYSLSSAAGLSLGPVLTNLIFSLEQLPGSQHLLSIYRTLFAYASVLTFADIVDLSLGKTPEIDSSHSPISQVALLIKNFGVIINNLNKSEKVALEHKLPYYADSFEVLNAIMNTAQDLPQPHQNVLTKIAAAWQSTITAELMRLKGQAELRIALKLRKFYQWGKLSIPIEIQNTGNSVAEDLKVNLIPHEEQFKVLDFDFNQLDILPPGKSIIVNFNIASKESGQIRIAIEVTFSDFEGRNKVHRFGDIIEVFDTEEKMAEVTDDYLAFMANPYIPGRPIQTPQMFFGRQDVIAVIEQSLAGRHQNNVIVLQGERRSGKTSILYYLANNPKDYVPVLIDAQGFLSRGTEYFLWQIAAMIQEQLQQRDFGVPVPEREAAIQNAEIWFRRDFLGAVKTSLHGQNLLILFDEFDSLEDRIREGTLDKEIFPFFRSLLQHENWLAFIFSGTYRLEEMVTEYWSILFNIAIYLRLEFLSETEARQLITEPVTAQFKFDEFAVERILSITSGHPYFVQLICFLIYNLHVREKKPYITSQDVDRIIDDVIETQAHTYFIWKDASRQERFVLSAMGQEARHELGIATPIMIQSALRSYQVALAHSDINDALAKLTRKGIISSDSTNTRFNFRVELVRRWLTRYKSLVSVIDESGR